MSPQRRAVNRAFVPRDRGSHNPLKDERGRLSQHSTYRRPVGQHPQEPDGLKRPAKRHEPRQDAIDDGAHAQVDKPDTQRADGISDTRTAARRADTADGAGVGGHGRLSPIARRAVCGAPRRLCVHQCMVQIKHT